MENEIITKLLIVYVMEKSYKIAIFVAINLQ